ncbi:sulfotransferase family 2 domain-containing protein [Pseudohaliea rubra]|uniref:Sulfotransferase family protein n=1 Tax=Pseudohaliea rubra DSM 19751 TaxID=1265313 RepID=A0A095XYQ7_9GAMM|nr:sulfotransferase family 2 domain-containing protein [Pseudohaliea rubra]KGE04901.1 hypothetical protein HRUBRA_00374 [Pseudohaliea rubra DSM 19751]
MKTVIVHYHIFKNSGSTFDKVLGMNFPGRHLAFDGPFDFSKISQDELLKILHNRDEIAFSSHQVNLPVPTSLDVQILPVVFIRHPLLRLRSIYRFRKRGANDAGMPASFREWVQRSAAEPRGMLALSNAQTRNLAAVYGRLAIHRRGADGGFCLDLSQALRNLDAVELLARTEFFDHDVQRFSGVLRAHGIAFSYDGITPENVTATDLSAPLDERLEATRGELGDELYEKLLAWNAQDLQLVAYANARLDG